MDREPIVTTPGVSDVAAAPIAQPERMDPANGLLANLEAGWQAHGDTSAVVINGLRCVIVAHPHDIRRVVTGGNYADKGPLYEGVRSILGDGVLTSGGQKWKDNRKLLTPVFHNTQISGMVDTMAAVGSTFVEGLRTRAQDGTPIDLLRETTALTLDTLAAVLFGKHAAAVQRLTHEQLTSTFSLAGVVGAAITDPYMKQRYDELTTELGGVAQDMLDAARGDEPDSTLLSMLAHTRDSETGEHLDDQTICDEVITIMFAGHETTALTLTWLFKALQENPAVAERVQQEVDTVLHGKKRPQLADIPKLAYTRQVIDEVLRLRPAVPVIARAASEADTIGGVPVRAGDVVMPFIWGAHRHPDFWQSPDTFNADNFASGAIRSRDKWAYLPFAAGSRICLGKNLALTELPIHAALILQGLRLQVAPNPIIPRVSMTLRPSSPVYAEVSPV